MLRTSPERGIWGDHFSRSTSLLRRSMFVLLKILRIWLFTVSSEIKSLCAISLLRKPSAASAATSRSRSLSPVIWSGYFSSMAKMRLSSALV